MFKTFQTFSFILALAFSIIAQTAPKPTPTPANQIDDDSPIEIKSRLVVVPVSVTDMAGLPIQGLKVTDFNLLEENKLQQLDQISPADDVPLEIALLIDISSSVDPLFEAEKQAAAKFLKEVMRPADRASVFTIGTKPFLYQQRETAEKAAERAASIVKPTDKSFTATAFYDAVIMAADYLKKNAPPTSRRIIVVISDGDDSNSEVTRKLVDRDLSVDQARQIANLSPKQARERAVKQRSEAREKVKTQLLRTMQNADTVFYSINPAGNSFHLNIPGVFGQETMNIFAQQTGGTAFLLKKPEDMDPIFRQLTGEIRAQYLLQYYPDMDFPVGRYVNLKVNVPGRNNVRIRARQGYFVKD